MNWNSQPTMYTMHADGGGYGKPDEFYEKFVRKFVSAAHTVELLQAWVEATWYYRSKPFYNVWPSIVDGFLRTKLDVPASFLVDRVLKMPESILMRFQTDGEPLVNGVKLKSIMGGRVPFSDGRGFVLFVDTGNENCEEVILLTSSWNLDKGSVMCRDTIISHRGGNLSDKDVGVIEAAWKVLLCTAMINDNPDFASKVVLRRHQEEYEKTGDRKFVLLAREKGIVGWDIGSKFVVSPHYRNAHFAIRWTGKDRAVPKLVPVKGCIVKKSKITDVPTGYEEQLESVHE